jgi:hypothetical protein
MGLARYALAHNDHCRPVAAFSGTADGAGGGMAFARNDPLLISKRPSGNVSVRFSTLSLVTPLRSAI